MLQAFIPTNPFPLSKTPHPTHPPISKAPLTSLQQPLPPPPPTPPSWLPLKYLGISPNTRSLILTDNSRHYGFEVPHQYPEEESMLGELRMMSTGMDVGYRVSLWDARRIIRGLGFGGVVLREGVDGGVVGVVKMIGGCLGVGKVGLVDVGSLGRGVVEIGGCLWGMDGEVVGGGVCGGVTVGVLGGVCGVGGGCWVRREVWMGVRRRVVNFYEVERFGAGVLLEDVEVVEDVGEGMGMVDGMKRVKVWELLAEDVVGGSDEYLRECLRFSEIAARSFSSRDEILELLLPVMDDVERRELVILEAKEKGQLSKAVFLQGQRSMRGQLLVELKDAIKEQQFGKAARIRSEMDRLRYQKADFTAEEGSYDRDLDQDDWYRPAR